MKPAVFYAVEDVASVDFKEGRAYRQALNARYIVLGFPFVFPLIGAKQ
jgi:hypothetical protein